MSLRQLADKLVKPLGRFTQHNYGEWSGLNNARAIAHAYNGWRYKDRIKLHQSLFQERFDELLAGNGPFSPNQDSLVMKDGYCFDRSGTLPFVQDILKEVGPIVDERQGKVIGYIQQNFFRSLFKKEDITKCPSLLNFPTSSAVLKTVGDYFQTVPVLSKTLSPGVRIMESNVKFDPTPDAGHRESQNYHLDRHSHPFMYCLVLLKEVTEQSGPWSFLGAETSAKAATKLRYGKRSVPYRISDEMMYEHVDPKELIVFTGKPGDVLFIDSSKCFHYGSRNAVVPRFLAMFAFTTPKRSDLTQTFLRQNNRPLEGASELRKIVLEPHE